MNRVLESFNRVSESLLHAVSGIGNAHYIDYSNSVELAKEDLDIIETELKEKEKQDEILRIIKEKKVDIDLLETILNDENQTDKLWSYNFWFRDQKDRMLTKKELNSLRRYFR